MQETDQGKVLNIRGITEDTHFLLRQYAKMSGLTQAKALNQALEVAIALDDLSGQTQSKALNQRFA
jgi:hypothetical protein